MHIVDRILTIVITATLTSALWIVAGGSLIENASSASQRDTTRPAEAAPSPKTTEVESTPTTAPEKSPAAEALEEEARLLDTNHASVPAEGDNSTLRIPVLNIRPSDLSDTFSTRRGEGAELHEALDIMAPRGTTVVAAAPGEVEKIFLSNAGGKTVFVRSDDGETIHYYAHLDSYAEGLREGQRIRRGQRLGTVGSTGNAEDEAPHLHFAILRTTPDAEWWEPANAINPYPLFVKGE